MMPAQQAGLSTSAEQLREVFDQSFTRAVAPDTTRWQDFLQIRLDGQVHVLALDEVASLQPLSWVTPIPGPLPALIGLIGHKGEIVPIYDLRTVLGHSASVAPRWMVVSRQADVALAFDAFDKHLRCPAEAVAQPGGNQAPGDHIRTHLQVGGQNWPIVSLVSVGHSIQEAARQCAQQQES
jgi:purine-binding chemotaxis protein CheW